MVVNFICNKFGGIRQKTAQFTDKVISCSDMQNVELYFTGLNSGVGIRTAKGQKGLIPLPDGERVVNLFESVQNGRKNVFIHSISKENAIYEVTDGENLGYTTIKGQQSAFLGDKNLIYKNAECSSLLGNLNTKLDIECSNPDLIVNNNYNGTREAVGSETRLIEYLNVYKINPDILTVYEDVANGFDVNTSGLYNFDKKISINDEEFNFFSAESISYPKNQDSNWIDLGNVKNNLFCIENNGEKAEASIVFSINDEVFLNDLYFGITINEKTAIKFTRLEARTYTDYQTKENTYVLELIYKKTNWENRFNIDSVNESEVQICRTKLDKITSLKINNLKTNKYASASGITLKGNAIYILKDSYIENNNNEKVYLANYETSGWFEDKKSIDLSQYSIEVLGNPIEFDKLKLIFTTTQAFLKDFYYTGVKKDGYGKLYLYDLALNKLEQKITGLARQTISSGYDYKQGYDDCFIFCNKGDFLYKIQLNKKVNSYQVKCDDIIGYVSENNIGTVSVGTDVYSDTNLEIKYKTIENVYEVKLNGEVAYVSEQGKQDDFVASGVFIYSDTKLTKIITESKGNEYAYTGKTEIGYKFVYTGYADKEISQLNFKDAENREIKPNFICINDNRICASISNRLHTCMQQNIFEWATGDVEKPTSAYYIEFSKEITAIYPYLNSLAVFFKDSSLLVKGSYPELQTTEEAPAGCSSYKSLIFHGTDLYFYDGLRKGIYSFEQVVLGSKTLGKDIAIEVNSLLDLIDDSRIEDFKTLSYVADDRNELWFLLPTQDENYSTILIFDTLRNEWTKRKSKKIYSFAICNDLLLSGGSKIYQEYVTNTFDGEFIQNFYNCSPFNLGSNTSMKILYLRPRMSVGFPYMNEFYVKYQKNFNSFKKPKVKKVKSKFKNYLIWGSGKWGVNYWAGGTTNSILKLPNVSAFKTLDITFYTTSEKENFAIRNLEMNQIDSIQT